MVPSVFREGGEWQGPTTAALVVGVLVLLVADQIVLRAGSSTLVRGIADESAHLLFGAVLLAALPWRGRGFVLGLLAGSILIDIDHIPGTLGWYVITRGTERPYSHSLLTLALIGLICIAWRSRRPILAGILLGVTLHFFRDLSESDAGVSLLWPLSYHSFKFPHWLFLLVLGVLTGLALYRVRRAPLPRPARSARYTASTPDAMPGRPAPAGLRLAGTRSAAARGDRGLRAGSMIAAPCVLATGFLVSASISPGASYAPPPAPPAPAGAMLLWQDDFTGPAGASPAASKWRFDTGRYGRNDGELETYTSRTANVSLDGHGDLVITALAPTSPSTTYTSARLDTAGVFSTTYGVIEARMKIPSGPGLWPAFWMLGDSIRSVGWPACGEIDVMEVLGNAPSVLYGSIHGSAPTPPYVYADENRFGSGRSLANGFHTYAVVWRRDSIAWFIDGYRYAQATPSQLPAGSAWPFNAPFHLVLDLAVGGTWPGPPTPSTRFPARLVVKWVRVYRLPG